MRAKPVSSTAPAGTATLSHWGIGAPSSFGAMVAPVRAITVSLSKRSVGPEELDLQPRRVRRVADQQVGEAEGPHVEGA